MLLEHVREAGTRRAVVLTRHPSVSRLLQAILEEWHFQVVPGSPRQAVALVELGLSAPEGVCHAIWIDPSAQQPAQALGVPLSLATLYQALQPWFFPVPRRYLRLSLDQPVQLDIRRMRLGGRLRSLSARGGRIACPNVLPKGESGVLAVTFGDITLHLEAEVIYVIPAGDRPDRDPPQAGLLFKPLRPELEQALHRFVEATLVERAAIVSGVGNDPAALSWFNPVVDPWADLVPKCG